MTTIDHALQLLIDTQKLVVNAGGPLDKAQRINFAEIGIAAVIGFLREVSEAHPQEAAGHWDDPEHRTANAEINGVDPGLLSVDPGLLSPDVADDEVDEDPPFMLATPPAIEEAFQRGYKAGQHDALEALAGPTGEQGPEQA